MTDQEDRGFLERFIVDNDDLEKLESLVNQFNIFEAIGVTRQELRHSDFLAFLLNPTQSHQLGDRYLNEAEAERQRAETERQRADQLAERLRQLGEEI
ncbi:PD-(D/E)XK nuclease family protein [Leptolyngbyaceae cyanobacterium UHCC 1019]